MSPKACVGRGETGDNSP